MTDIQHSITFIPFATEETALDQPPAKKLQPATAVHSFLRKLGQDEEQAYCGKTYVWSRDSSRFPPFVSMFASLALQ